jgi:flagellar motor switch protein FliN/FliY
MSDTEHLSLPELDARDPHTLRAPGEIEAAPEPAITEADLDPVLDVPITLTAILGRTQLPVADVLRLNAGSVVELNRAIGEPIDICINDQLVARGEVVLINEQLAITLSEIVAAIV